MNKLTELFRLIELARSQPQYGYALAGIPKDELSDLAQHHYLVAFIAWQLAANLNAKGAKLNVEKVLELALVHDLGELLGGDISMPYARANPKARKLAKNFEKENLVYLSKFFGLQAAAFRKAGDEIMEPKTDEGLVAKIADYVEATHYKLYMGRLSEGDIHMAEKGLHSKIAKFKDAVAKKEMAEFIVAWGQDLLAARGKEFFESSKNL
ncbi:MAG: HD domain-containing protein [Patescibacteria group bacterium]|nr:HD domain-containing protein [Patescibacteria group bacterium]